MNYPIKISMELQKVLKSIGKTISIVLPVFNDEYYISQFLKKIPKNERIEIIVVDDASRDRTVEIINKMDFKITLIRHKKNLGYFKSLVTGIKASKGDIIIILDVGETYDPIDILNLLRPIIENEADIVIGSKYKGKIFGKVSSFERLMDKFYEITIKLLYGKKITDIHSGFRAYSRKTITIFQNVDEYTSLRFYAFTILNALNFNYKVLEVPITYRKRFSGIIYFSKLRIISEFILDFIRFLFKKFQLKKPRKIPKKIRFQKSNFLLLRNVKPFILQVESLKPKLENIKPLNLFIENLKPTLENIKPLTLPVESLKSLTDMSINLEPLLKVLSENVKPFKNLFEHMNSIINSIEKLNQQSFSHLFELPEQQLNFIQNFTKIQKIGEIREKAVWRYGDKIEMNKNEFEELDSKNTFTSVKIALTEPRLKNILSKKIKFSDINDDKVYKLIKSLPKVDLHCHLGGCARLNDLKEIAKTYPEDKTLYENIEVFFIKNKDLNLDLFFNQSPEVIVKEIFSLKDNDNFKPDYFASIIKYLDKNKYLDKLNCIYKKESELRELKMLLDDDKPSFNFFGIGLKNYLKFGDWGGSTLLQKESALKKAIECLSSFAKEHNVKYLELRFNPLGYTKNGLSGKDVYQIIRDAVIKYCDGLIINFIFISGKPNQDTQKEKRKYKQKLLEIINLYLEIYEEEEKIDFNKSNLWYPKLVGFDFAGLEDFFQSNIKYGYNNIIEDTRNELKALLEKEICITIHCGETKSISNQSKEEIVLWNKSISDAIHILNANRLGHALNINDPSLLKSLAKFNKTIELCPSSNCQISNFNRTPWVFSKKNQDKLQYVNRNEFTEYPLRKYLNENLKVCINTDNPGISKTDWTREIFIASEICEYNLSIEQIIELIYNGIEGSFLSVPYQKKLKYLFSEEIGNLLNI